MSTPAARPDRDPAVVLGGAQTDFARHLTREGRDVADLVAEVLAAACEDALVDPGEVEVVHVGNAFGELFTGQGHLAALPATVEPRLDGVPGSRHEAACASGGVALLAALADLEAGRYDLALVLGVELERTMSGADAARTLGAAAWVGHELQDETFVWPRVFADLGATYLERDGATPEHFRALGELAFRNARDNPSAQTRDWVLPPAAFTADDSANPVVSGLVRRHDCSQITDGAAAVLLASPRWLADRPARRPTGPVARVVGWGHRTSVLPAAPKLARPGSPYLLPHVRRAVTDAYTRAGLGVTGRPDVDAFETHDCFTPSAYLGVEALGLAPPGRAWQAVESGALERSGATPLNPGGGLVGGGHPVGATGVRMVLDASRQVTGRAGACQVAGARTVATLNIGGSTATTVSTVVSSR